MRRRWKKQTSSFEMAVANFGLTLAKAFMVVLLAAFAMMSTIKKDTPDGVKPNAQYVIIVSWDDNAPNDIDTWVQDPQGMVVWFQAKERGLLNLDRDDTGASGDSIILDGKTVKNPLNQEIVSIRGIVPGEYIVNVHLFTYYKTTVGTRIEDERDDSNKEGQLLPDPVPVTITIQKINPTVEIVYTQKLMFTHYREELHVTRFTINPDGSMVDFDSMRPISLFEKYYSTGAMRPGGY